MSALAHPSGRPRGRRAALIVLVVLVTVLAVLLVIVATDRGRSAPQAPSRLVGKPPPAPLSDARHTLDPAAAGTARTFLTGYLAFIYGEGSLGQIRDASPQLIAVLGKAHPPPASPRRPHPRILALGAHESGGSVLHVTALINDGIVRYPLEIEIARGPGGWQATKLVDDE